MFLFIYLFCLKMLQTQIDHLCFWFPDDIYAIGGGKSDI